MSMLRNWWKAPLERIGLKKPEAKAQANPENQFDALIMKAAKETGVEWFVLKGMIWQESRFNPKAESPAGAKGLTQLMPGTALDLGVKDPFDPEESIMGGATYLAARYAQFKKEDGITRWRFALAAYNCGAGYVYEAQRIVQRGGMDPTSWPLVSHALPRARIRGKVPHWAETVVYVEKVIDRAFDYYVEAVRKVNK